MVFSDKKDYSWVIKRFVLYGLLIVLPLIEAFAVFPEREIVSRRIQDNNDTLMLTRTNGDWWFGVDVGANFELFFGKLNLPYSPREPVDDFQNRIFSYNTGNGAGLFFGLLTEYHPVGKKLGGALKIQVLDFRPSYADTDPFKKDSTELKNKSTFNLFYVSISPSAVYNFGIDNLNLFGGIDLDFLISDKAQVQTFFINTGDIYHDKPFTQKSNTFRIGGAIGLEYDIFVADISNKARAFLSPFISFHGGSNIFSDYNSSRNMVLFRVGFVAKLVPDKILEHEIHYNKDYEKPIDELAEFKYQKPPRFQGFNVVQNAPSVELSQVIQPQISQEVAETPKIQASVAVNSEKLQIEAAKLQVTPNEDQKFYYNRSEQTGLTPEMMAFLDQVADYMKQNPRATVRIVGHSDNAGSLNQNMSRSLDRAKQVVDYLLKKKIQRGRILDRGAGALEPVANNATPSGRKQNRRVEIRVIQ